jgi:hypothetical protein
MFHKCGHKHRDRQQHDSERHGEPRPTQLWPKGAEQRSAKCGAQAHRASVSDAPLGELDPQHEDQAEREKRGRNPIRDPSLRMIDIWDEGSDARCRHDGHGWGGNLDVAVAHCEESTAGCHNRERQVLGSSHVFRPSWLHRPLD